MAVRNLKEEQSWLKDKLETVQWLEYDARYDYVCYTRILSTFENIYRESEIWKRVGSGFVLAVSAGMFGLSYYLSGDKQVSYTPRSEAEGFEQATPLKVRLIETASPSFSLY